MGIEIRDRFDCNPWDGWAKVQYVSNAEELLIPPVESPFSSSDIDRDACVGVVNDPHKSWQVRWEDACEGFKEIMFRSADKIDGGYRWIVISNKLLLSHNGLAKGSWRNPRSHRLNVFAPGYPDDGKAFDGPQGLWLRGSFYIYVRRLPE